MLKPPSNQNRVYNFNQYKAKHAKLQDLSREVHILGQFQTCGSDIPARAVNNHNVL